MPLTPGARLGSYQVTAPLGEGGMGEVYRATDTTLGRSVAVKVLSQSFALDSDRLARFEREARTLAALNHPNIAQVYGYENVNGVRALIMELVEGPTLADRIAEGPIPIDEALAIARQIATALEVAHDAGIIHRDLKPANVKVRPDGTVKVLDFGLAKAVEPTGASSTDLSPTITSPALVTGAGVLLGTAGYMAPEQARGKAVDKRVDIWAFGAVLYEMLTGDRLWAGETNLDVLAQVVHKEPDLQRVPRQVRRLLSRCLEKDPKKRLRDICGVELLLEEPVTVAPSRSRLAVGASIAAGVLAVALALVTWTLWPAPSIEPPVSRFSLEAPPDAEFTNIFPGAAVSPDGRLLVFVAQRSTLPTLWLRPIDSLDARQLPGTESANFPFWSADGRSIAFITNSDRRLKRTDALGGTPQTLCDAPGFEGGTWSREGAILFSAGGSLHQVAGTGGSCTAVTKLDPSGIERHTWPHFLPDGRSFLYLVRSTDSNVEGVYLSSLDQPERRTKLVSTQTKALYAPPYDGQPGFLLWLRDLTLMAQRFDPASGTLEGDPMAIAEQISVGGGTSQGLSGRAANRAAFWISDNGLLVYRAGDASGRSVVWASRDGKVLDTVLQEDRDGEILGPALSPDGARLAVERDLSDVSDLWVYEMARRVWRKLTSTPGREMGPVWSPDSSHLAFSAERDGVPQIYRINVNDGQEQRLTDGPNGKVVVDWSEAGQYLIYAESHPQNQRDLWILPLDGPGGRPGKPIPFLTTPADELGARFSPDGRWIAYVSNTTGRAEASIRAFPGGPAGEWPVSNNGAANLAWHANGSELFYRPPSPGGTGDVMAAPISLRPDRVEIGTPRTLFRALNGATNVSKDGQRFLIMDRPSETAKEDRSPLTVVLNWQSALK